MVKYFFYFLTKKLSFLSSIYAPNNIIRKHTNIRAYVTYLVVSAHAPPQPQPRLLAPPTKYHKIMIDSNCNRDLQIAVAVVGVHSRKTWMRLEIAAAVENGCRVWGPLSSRRIN